jgi:hypothetical protein
MCNFMKKFYFAAVKLWKYNIFDLLKIKHLNFSALLIIYV